MLDQLFLSPDTSKSGTIIFFSGVYIALPGWNCSTGQNTSVPTSSRAYLAFDTSGLPAGAQIEQVELFIRRGSDPVGEPEIYRLRFSIGSFIGESLDGDAGEWTGGDLMVTLFSTPADKQWLDLSSDGQDPCPLINPAGYTDVKIWDDSDQGSGDPEWSTSISKDQTTLTKLSVIYSTPSVTMTGRGSMSVSAEVRRGMSATLEGVGSLAVSGAVTASGAATLVGTGSLLVSASLLLDPRPELLTGRGTIDAGAVLTLSAGSITVSGRGSLGAAANLVLDVGATLTGVGSLNASSALLLSLPAVTMTGRGLLSCSLETYVDVEPYALHAATRSISSSHSGSRAVGGVHSSSVACEDTESGTRGPRRGN